MIVRKVLVLLFSILIYTLAIHKVGDIIRPGLDESYVLAINKYFANLEYSYSKIFFSYGPLGFLIVPLPVGLNIILSTIFWNILIFFFSHINIDPLMCLDCKCDGDKIYSLSFIK